MPAPRPSHSGTRYAGILELVAKAALLGGPLFYVLGRVYADGYWTALGVASSVMGGDAEDYIYLGFIVIASGIAALMPHWESVPVWVAPPVSLLLAAVLAVFVWIFGRVKSWLSFRLRKAARRLRLSLARKKSVLEALGAFGVACSFLSVACSIFLALLVLSVALLLPIVIAHSVGENRAKKVSEQLRIGENVSGFAPVEVDGKAIGRLIECSDRYCVVYAHGQFRPVPSDTVRWIERQTKTH